MNHVFEARSSSANCRNPRHLLLTLARDLVDVIPEIRQSVCEAINGHHDIQDQALEHQWKHLIFNLLRLLRTRPPLTVIFILDALDECHAGTRDGHDDIQVIIRLLGQYQRGSVQGCVHSQQRYWLSFTDGRDHRRRTLPTRWLGDREWEETDTPS